MDLFNRSLRYSSHREFVPLVVEQLGLKDMVEVGVLFGALTTSVLNKCPQIKSYYLVDPWKPFTKPIIQSPAVWDERYEHVKAKMEQYGSKVNILRLTSLEAAKQFEMESLDFVYIDGNHSFRHVDEDIKAWWPKLRQNGYLAGHDIGKPEHSYKSSRWPGVLKAVEANFDKRYYCGEPTTNWDGVWIVDKAKFKDV